MAREHEYVHHADHYNNYDVETIEMIARIWGDFMASMWSEINAFKYRMRVGTKPTAPIEQDLEKEKVYMGFFNKYKDKWEKKETIPYEELPEIFQHFVDKIVKKTEIPFPKNPSLGQTYLYMGVTYIYYPDEGWVKCNKNNDKKLICD